MNLPVRIGMDTSKSVSSFMVLMRMRWWWSAASSGEPR